MSARVDTLRYTADTPRSLPVRPDPAATGLVVDPAARLPEERDISTAAESATGSGASAQALRLRALTNEVAVLQRGLPSALLAAAIGAFIMLGAMWGSSSTAAGLTWLGLHLGVIGLRYAWLRRVRAEAVTLANGRRRHRILIAGILASGVTWGASVLVFYAAGDPIRQTVLGLLLVAVAGGGVSLHVSSMVATAAFVIPTVGPISLVYIFHAGTVNQALGAAGILFVAVLMIAARQVSRHIAANHELRLQLERRSKQLAASQQKIALHVELTPVGVVEWDRDFRVVGWNPAATRIFGYGRREALKLHASDLMFETDRVHLDTLMADLYAGRGGEHSVGISRTRDGKRIHCEWSTTPLVTDDGEVIGVTSLVQDVTGKIETEAVLRESEEKFRSLVERSLAGVYMIAEGKFIYANPMLAQIFGYRSDEVIGKSVSELVASDDREIVLENIRQRLGGSLDSLRYQFRGERKDGSQVDVEVIGTRGEIGGRSVILGTLLDVSDAVKARDRIEHLANFDSLTDLPNRAFISSLADKLIRSSHRDRQALACLYIDLDRFKNVNDTLGHDVGDQLLNEAAQRMRRCLRAEDTLARMGGDEFTVLLPQADQEIVATAARRIIRTLNEPFSIRGRLIRVGASIGAARLDSDIENFNELWKRADIAMYRAKRNRGTFSFYDASQESELTTRVRLENDLGNAIDSGQLSLHYQPRVDMRRHVCPSVEALLRWQHPELGWVSPAVFVPIAENGGVIHRLGEWVLRHACEQIRVWREAGLTFRVAVNLSILELQRVDVVARIEGVLLAARVDPRWLELEVTESAAMEDPQHTVAVVSQLRELGVTISIDDFGTGYSSLSYLKRIPAHHLKIDQSFLRGIDVECADTTVDADIVRAIIALSKSLGMETIAEGVEEPEQRTFLLQLGCDLAQGYFFARPMPADELAAWVRNFAHAD